MCATWFRAICVCNSFCSVKFSQLTLRVSPQNLALCALIDYQHLQCMHVRGISKVLYFFPGPFWSAKGLYGIWYQRGCFSLKSRGEWFVLPAYSIFSFMCARPDFQFPYFFNMCVLPFNWLLDRQICPSITTDLTSTAPQIYICVNLCSFMLQ